MWAADLTLKRIFDHHQRQSTCAKDGQPTVVHFGLIWAAYGQRLSAALDVPEADVITIYDSFGSAGLSCRVDCWTMVPSTRQERGRVCRVLPCGPTVESLKPVFA